MNEYNGLPSADEVQRRLRRYLYNNPQSIGALHKKIGIGPQTVRAFLDKTIVNGFTIPKGSTRPSYATVLRIYKFLNEHDNER